MDAKHTPLPWTGCREGNCSCGYIYSSGAFVARFFGGNGMNDVNEIDPVPLHDYMLGNVALALRAVNMHDDLVTFYHEFKETARAISEPNSPFSRLLDAIDAALIAEGK